jgi:hypothetical protein
MKHILLAVLLLLGVKTTTAQIVTNGDTLIGIGKFSFGDSLSKFTADLKILPLPLKDGNKSYQYLASLTDSIKIGNINFNIVFLDFDSTDRLITIYMSKFFRPKNFLKESRTQYENIIAYLNKTLNKEGVKKEYTSNIIHQYEWEKANSKVMVELQETKDFSSTSLGITLTQFN